MTDIFLYAGESNPSDLKLRDPTILAGGGAITGTGVLVAGVASLAGIGKSASRSTAGILLSQSAILAGVGKGASKSTTAALLSQAAILAGGGKSASRSTTAVLLSQSAAIAGSGTVGGAGAPGEAPYAGFLANVGRLGLR